MIQANEFRIGNLISDIHASSSFYAEIKKITKDRVYYGSFNSHPKDLKLIPLTEEWHNKFGVYKNGFNSFEYEIDDIFSFGIKIIFTEDYVYLRQGNKNNMHEDDIVSIWNKDLTKREMFVHEWQNLYFALTNEELTLKL